MQPPLPLTREVVLIGGGHAHALVLRRWGMHPVPGARLTVINPGPTAPYTGMLPGHVAGHYDRDALEIDLVRLARFAGARLILGRADGIDRAARRIHVAGRGEIAYDIASLDIGIRSDLPNLPGFATYAVGAKPLGPYAARWRGFLADVAAGTARPEVAVIGAGVGGVELSMAMAHALRVAGARPEITVLEKDRALPGLAAATRQRLIAEMRRLGVVLREAVEVAEVTADAVRLADGTRVASALTVGAAGARPFGWLAGTGLDLTEGFVTVDETLRSVTDPAIYAAGDCAHFLPAPRPKAGVYAVRAAPILAHNIRADLTGAQRRRFKPQRDYLKLISLGGQTALADKFGLRVAAPALWHWKDRIDRRFMDGFKALRPMEPPAPPRAVAAGVHEALQGGKPYCGGCGAKLGGAVLARVLAGLPAGARDDVETRPGDDAAVLRIGGARQVLTTDHLRAFNLDPWIMARIAAVHALGDVWAMGARPQAALATVILPRLSDAMAEAWMAEIMAAAAEVFAAEGAEIVGGHSSVGSELTLGFTVTGFLSSDPITLAGARPGDALILSRPIGSGTLLAGEMVLKANGNDVAAALEIMGQPQGDAARLLSKAHAMTDVTGFGLAGHLLAICDASGTGAEIRLDAVPVLDGAEALAAAGVRSTLYPQNRQAAERMTLPDAPRAALLFDPQTAGGLLAAVPAERAASLVAGLQALGHRAAHIGRLTEGPATVAVL